MPQATKKKKSSGSISSMNVCVCMHAFFFSVLPSFCFLFNVNVRGVTSSSSSLGFSLRRPKTVRCYYYSIETFFYYKRKLRSKQLKKKLIEVKVSLSTGKPEIRIPTPSTTEKKWFLWRF